MKNLDTLYKYSLSIKRLGYLIPAPAKDFWYLTKKDVSFEIFTRRNLVMIGCGYLLYGLLNNNNEAVMDTSNYDYMDFK